MKLIKPSTEILFQELDKPLPNGSMQEELVTRVYKQVEVAGRTCYKSEDKITDDSCQEFVQMLRKRGHYAMLEHGTVYLQFEAHLGADFPNKYWLNKYSQVVTIGGYAYVTTNLRVIFENNWDADLEYICACTEHHEKRISVRFICDRGVSHKQFVPLAA